MNRQLVYSFTTSLCIPLIIPERINLYVYFSEFFSCCFRKWLSRQKRQQRNFPGMLFRCLLISLKIFLKYVTESKFRKSSGIYIIRSEEFVTGSAFNKASVHNCKWQWETSWQRLFLASGCDMSAFSYASSLYYK